MILTIYLLLLGLSLLSLLIGLTFKENYFSFIGFFFLFNLGIILMTGALEYTTGESITSSYNYVNGTINNTASTITINYTDFDKTSAHWYLSLIHI